MDTALPPATRLEPSFWKEIAAVPGGEAVVRCIQCGTCASSCPVEAHDPSFNVRRLIARVRLGLREEVLGDPAIWTCVRCFACVARCPKDVMPGEILAAARAIALREHRDGPGPRHARAFADSVRQNGRIQEARVTLDSVGAAGLLREGLLPLQLAFRGKAPSLRAHPIETADEVRVLLDAAGAVR